MFCAAFPNDGSSPRVRGTQPLEGLAVHWPRFIPACAGNTQRGRTQRCRRQVHPRVCGEHSDAEHRPLLMDGSSPRVRGTPQAFRLEVDNERFIPACAGNTAVCVFQLRVRPVHPRVCGEHPWRRRLPGHESGSSPRVRGTHDLRAELVHQRRFIPACAGNTQRGRGQGRRVGGSSPRVRGTRWTLLGVG